MRRCAPPWARFLQHALVGGSAAGEGECAPNRTSSSVPVLFHSSCTTPAFGAGFARSARSGVMLCGARSFSSVHSQSIPVGRDAGKGRRTGDEPARLVRVEPPRRLAPYHDARGHARGELERAHRAPGEAVEHVDAVVPPADGEERAAGVPCDRAHAEARVGVGREAREGGAGEGEDVQLVLGRVSVDGG